MAISTTVGKVTELTLINPVKPGHAAALREFLSHIDPLTIRPLETIHFARWVLFDDDTRLLFTSNFDGSLHDYLQDFVQVMPDGMDGIWQHCEEYPERGLRAQEAGPLYANPTFIVSMFVLVLTAVVVMTVLFREGFSPDMQAFVIGNVIGGGFMGVLGYWIGTTRSSTKRGDSSIRSPDQISTRPWRSIAAQPAKRSTRTFAE